MIILQSEAAECGLACVAMVAAHYGRKERLLDLRRKYQVSLSGSTLKSLIAIADDLGLAGRPLRCELDDLKRVDVPAILHWSMDHYVVLLSVKKRGIKIIDPARGQRLVSYDEASRNFTGVLLELTPNPSFEKKNVLQKVRLTDLWSRLTGVKRFILQIFVLTIFLQVVALITPLANQLIIDDVLGRGDRDLLVAIAFGFGMLALTQSAIELLRGFIQLHAGQKLSIQLSGNLLRHLLRLPTEFFERRHVGDVLSRFSSLGPPRSFLTTGIVGVALDAIFVIPVSIVMVMYSPVLSGLVAINLIVIFVIRTATFPIARRMAEENINLGAVTDSIFLETVRAARAIKIAGREVERHSHWQNAVIDEQNASFRQGVFGLWGGAGLGIWTALHGISMLSIGAIQVLQGNLTLGMFFAFQSYAGQFSARISSLTSAYFTFRMLGLHLERLGDIVHTDEEPGLDSHSTVGVEGRLEVKNLKFRYGDHDKWILEDVSFTVSRGQSLAIVGPSGGGKSTLFKLLIGLYKPTEGKVLIDGYEMQVLGIRSTRERFGVVMQDDQLLSGSILDNVSFFDTDVDIDRVEYACKNAFIHDDIMNMPMGYNGLIGDMGSTLSGGQKQRLLLARALYKDPKILFMDEGTANLDPELERLVMQTLSELKITRIMVAHREAAVRVADQVLMVNKGNVIDVTESMTRTSGNQIVI